MDDDAFPNFDNAFAGASPSINSASWNPALRPDTEQQPTERKQTINGDEDDFFDRYQEPTPRKKRIETPADDDVTEEAAEEAAWGSPAQKKQSISVEDEVHVSKAAAAPEELGMKPETTADVEAPISHHDHPPEEDSAPVPQDEDAAVFSPNETVEEQAWGLEEHMPEVANEAPPAVAEPGLGGVEQTDQAAVQEEAQRPEEHYDYQGEVTEMEDAIDESAEAPLMADEEPTPVAGVVSRAPTFEAQPNGFDDSTDDQAGQPPAEPSEPQPPPMIERSFTTNFTEAPQKHREEPTTEHQGVVDEDWPAAGDDKTFGDLLDDQQDPEQGQHKDTSVHERPHAPTLSANPATSRSSELEWPTAGDDEVLGDIAGNTDSQETHEPLSEASENYRQQNDTADGAWSTAADDTAFDALLRNQTQEAPAALSSEAEDGQFERDQQKADAQWPTEEADDTFGELLGNNTNTSDALEGLAIDNLAVSAAPSDQPVEEDLSAAFAAALDDDDILDDNELDPATLFGDDDDGLLEDDDFLGVSQDEPQSFFPQQSAVKTSYTPSAAQHQFQQPTIGTPGMPFMEQNMSRSAGTPSTGLFDVHNEPVPSQEPQRPALTSAQSFVDKAKGGYQSPYDLPMEEIGRAHV